MDLSQVRAICDAAMWEYGMPARIRTDNGAPFAGTGLLGLSKLSLGWMKLGIVHERIQAGRPQQNGRHERMHRTVKEDTTKPPAASLRAQQSRFDNFRYVFNNERPHEGLNNQVPASLYIPSAIRLPSKLQQYMYPKGLQLRRVNNSGDISWHKNRIFISEVFRFEELGVELITPGLYRVFFRNMEIGELNSEELPSEQREGSPEPVSECIGLFSSVENAWADYWRETDFIVLSPFDSVPLQVPTLGSKL
jgi:hypothetical protein